MSKIKTEYRIIPYKTFIGDMYLQFKFIEKKKNFIGRIVVKETWRFVPEESFSKVIGNSLSQDSCPKLLNSLTMNEAYYMHSFYKQEKYFLIPFTKKYPNIEKYFEYLREIRKEYLKEQEEKNNAKIINL